MKISGRIIARAVEVMIIIRGIVGIIGDLLCYAKQAVIFHVACFVLLLIAEVVKSKHAKKEEE